MNDREYKTALSLAWYVKAYDECNPEVGMSFVDSKIEEALKKLKYTPQEIKKVLTNYNHE